MPVYQQLVPIVNVMGLLLAIADAGNNSNYRWMQRQYALVEKLGKVRTIQVKDETKHRLERLGRKGDTYDDVIRKLLNNYDRTLTSTAAAE